MNARQMSFCVALSTVLLTTKAVGQPSPPNTPLVITNAKITVPLKTPPLKAAMDLSVRVTCSLLAASGQSLNQATEIAAWGAPSVVVQMGSGPFQPGKVMPATYECKGEIVHCMYVVGSYNASTQTFVGRFQDVTATFGPSGQHLVTGTFPAGDPFAPGPNPHPITFEIPTKPITFGPSLKPVGPLKN